MYNCINNRYEMYRLLSVILFVVSASALVPGQEYGVLKGIQKSRTYRFDSITGDYSETEVKKCTKPGSMCGNCEVRYECIQMGEDFLQEEVEVCAEGSTCMETSTTAYCTTEPNPGCNVDNYIFPCHQLGMFPDPFNCKKYHLCMPENGMESAVNPRSKELTCPGGFYYDARTNLCRMKLVNNTCPVVAAPCKSIGQVGSILNNPAMYFICLKQDAEIGFFPNLFVCPKNHVYDLNVHSCKDPTPESGIRPDGKCEKVGLFYEPTSCFYYNQCSTVGGTPSKRLCASKMHFDPKTQKCIDFTCADLDK